MPDKSSCLAFYVQEEPVSLETVDSAHNLAMISCTDFSRRSAPVFSITNLASSFAILAPIYNINRNSASLAELLSHQFLIYAPQSPISLTVCFSNMGKGQQGTILVLRTSTR